MGKSKIIFIGDYKEDKIKRLLRCFVDRYEDTYDIFASGYNLGYIDEDLSSRVSKGGMSSNGFIYYKATAKYVVITTQAVHYAKIKYNQKIIYVISEFDMFCFNGCFGDIDRIITGNESVAEVIRGVSNNKPVCLVDLEHLESIVEAIGIAESRSLQYDYLVITDDIYRDVLNGPYGLHHLFKLIKKDPGNNVIFCGATSDELATSYIPLLSSSITLSVLKGFEGTVLFANDYLKEYFNQFIKDEGIELKTDKLLMFSDVQLEVLHKTVEEHEPISFEDGTSEYVKYRCLLEKLYDINHCDESKVSIIICRYNTPLDLLNRAIDSALNCGHSNVEVIVVDDGSEDNIESSLKESFCDERLKYYYKNNEGPGLSRNYGVRHATGKYVFYLDSDDSIHKDGMRCLVSHADFFNVDMAIGKRVLCDEEGVPRHESLKYLAGDLFTCYYAGITNRNIYIDVMINNRLINRQSLIDADVWFTKGLYEDVEYSSKLYSMFSEYHYINVPIHDWYQYGDNTTISSTVSLRNLEERIIKEESAWGNCPELLKKARLYTILLNDFNLYLNSFYSFPEDERARVFSMIKSFIDEKTSYITIDRYSEKTKELTRSLLANDYDYFKYVINRYYTSPKTSEEQHEDFIVFTYYHLYIACLYALRSRHKCRLYICNSYVPFDTNMVYKIRRTGLFDCVKTFIYNDVVGGLIKDLDERPGEDSIVIPHYLYNKFNDIFKDCDKKNDVLYIFSDSLPYWYYVEREFEHIIKLEDAYNSFDREVKTHEIQGIWAGIQKYEGKTFPLMFFRSDKIEKIIVSSRPESIPEDYYSKIEVRDTKLLEKEVYDDIRSVMLSIFDVDSDLFTSDATLLLTQPLALFGYCDTKEQKRLMKKMCAPYSGSPLLIKPHPADKMNYKSLGGTILPKSVPIEVYNYMDVSIARVITFGSSAIETIDIAREKKAYFKLHDFEYSEVENAIKEMTKPDPMAKRIKRKLKRMVRK